MSQPVKASVTPKPNNLQKVKEAIALGKKLSKTPEITKVAVAMKMFSLIHNESREVISKAFMEGANLTEKGAMTYYYNCRRNYKGTKK